MMVMAAILDEDVIQLLQSFALGFRIADWECQRTFKFQQV
jgi:hypothetical protein